MKLARKIAVRMVVAAALIGAPHAVLAQTTPSLTDPTYGGGWKTALVNGLIAAVTTIGSAACTAASGLGSSGAQTLLSGLMSGS